MDAKGSSFSQKFCFSIFARSSSQLSQIFEEKNALSIQLRGSSQNLRESHQHCREVLNRCMALERQLQELQSPNKDMVRGGVMEGRWCIPCDSLVELKGNSHCRLCLLCDMAAGLDSVLFETLIRLSHCFTDCPAQHLMPCRTYTLFQRSLVTDAAPGAPQEKNELQRECYTPELQELQLR